MHGARPRSAAARRCAASLAVLAATLGTGACLPDGSPSAQPTHVSNAPSDPPDGSSAPTEPTTEPTTGGTPSEVPTVPAEPAVTPTGTPTTTPTAPPAPVEPVVVVLREGDSGSKVRAMQSRLRQIGWFPGDVTDSYGPRSVAAVKGFQGKRGFPATGVLDQTTWDRLRAMTREPTADELANKRPEAEPGALTWDVDERCLTGRVMCVSKTTRKLTWVVDGVPQYQFSVRFGSDELPTREGVFHVYKKKVDVISNLYHTPMPYSMFFSGGQAVHYSSNFARLGYAGASHGCVNVRDHAGIVRLYEESRIGDAVVIHW